MEAWQVVVMAVCAICFALVVRNLIGAPSRFGIVSGRVSMVAFATFAAFFFWKARELRGESASPEQVWGALRLLVACAVGTVLSAASVSVQRRRSRGPKPS